MDATLMTDEQIVAEAEALAASWNKILDSEQVCVLRYEVVGLVRSVVNSEGARWVNENADLRAELDALRQELAARQDLAQPSKWTPLDDGRYEAQHEGCSLHIDGEWLTCYERILGGADTCETEIALLDDIRLCRRTPVQPAP